MLPRSDQQQCPRCLLHCQPLHAHMARMPAPAPPDAISRLQRTPARHRTNLFALPGLMLAAALAWTPVAAEPGTPPAPPMLETRSDVRVVREGYAQAPEQWAEAAERERRLKGAPAKHRSHDHAPVIWLAGVDTLLYTDRDNDGYFRGFSLEFDVDSEHGEADVYAVISLGLDGYVEPMHTTDTFAVYGELGSDAYRVEIDLLSRFEAGHYDVRLDIHDAWSGDLLESASWRRYRNLAGLPLESADDDRGYGNHSDPPADEGFYVATEYAGALGLWSLALLAALGVGRYTGATGLNPLIEACERDRATEPCRHRGGRS